MSFQRPRGFQHHKGEKLSIWCAAAGSTEFGTETLLLCPRSLRWLVERPESVGWYAWRLSPVPVPLAEQLSLVTRYC